MGLGFCFFVFIILAPSWNGGTEKKQFSKIDFSNSITILDKDSVNIHIVMSIPPKYKNPKAIIELTPYFVDCNNDSTAFQKYTTKGEEANGKFKTISYIFWNQIEFKINQKLNDNCENIELRIHTEIYHHKHSNRRISLNHIINEES